MNPRTEATSKAKSGKLPFVEFNEICDGLSALGTSGVEMTLDFIDHVAPTPSSHLGSLKQMHMERSPSEWLEHNVDFLVEALKGLLGIAASQLDGMTRLVKPGPPIKLHPLVTLVRGVAEACGTISWLIDPFVVHPGEEVDPDPEQWWQKSTTALSRSELLQLEARINRLKRLRAAYTVSQLSLDDAERAFETLRTELGANHGTANVIVRGRRQDLLIVGQAFLTYTDLVRLAVENSHGPTYVGTGMNPYPMFSGFAHASLEVLFSQAPSDHRPGMASLFDGEAGEIRDVFIQGLRLLESHYEMVTLCFGVTDERFLEWSQLIRSFIEDTM